MGGAQMYIRNKLLYLRNKGWWVDVIAGQGSNVMIPELAEFQSFYRELLFSPYLFSNKAQERIIKKIITRITSDVGTEEVVIESHTIATSLWAEMLAKQTRAKHLVYLLNEIISVTNPGIQSFLFFKLKRRELAGINTRSLSTMFAPFATIPLEQSYKLSAYCNNVEADIDCSFLRYIDKTKYDFIIGIFSRLDKPFVLPAISSLLSFTKLHQDNRFLFLLIGDAPKESSFHSVIRSQLTQTSNIELIITGYLYPVPIRLLEMCDVFLSSAASSRVCQRSGVPTITFDGRDLKPIGILGETTDNTNFRNENEQSVELQQLLDQVLYKKIFKRSSPSFMIGLPDFQSHLDFLSQSDTNHLYYQISTIQMDSVKDIIVKIVGASYYLRICYLFQRFRNKQHG